LDLGPDGLFFSAAAAHFIGATHAPYIRHELLFLAALLGGWPQGSLRQASPMQDAFSLGVRRYGFSVLLKR